MGTQSSQFVGDFLYSSSHMATHVDGTEMIAQLVLGDIDVATFAARMYSAKPGTLRVGGVLAMASTQTPFMFNKQNFSSVAECYRALVEPTASKDDKARLLDSILYTKQQRVDMEGPVAATGWTVLVDSLNPVSGGRPVPSVDDGNLAGVVLMGWRFELMARALVEKIAAIDKRPTLRAYVLQGTTLGQATGPIAQQLGERLGVDVTRAPLIEDAELIITDNVTLFLGLRDRQHRHRRGRLPVRQTTHLSSPRVQWLRCSTLRTKQSGSMQIAAMAPATPGAIRYLSRYPTTNPKIP
jgi:hypothetical protein